MKSRKQISKEEEDRHTLAEALREEKKDHSKDVQEERADRTAPQGGIGRSWPGREGGPR